MNFINEDGELRVGKIITVSVLVLVGIIALFGSMRIVRSGEVGVKTRFGKVLDVQVDDGLNFKIPIIEAIHKVNIKVQKADVMSNGASKDLQDVKMEIVVNYKVNGTQARELYKNIGQHYEEVVLTPAIQETIKAVSSEYTAEELITKRQEVSSEATDKLQKKIKKYGLIIDNFNITNFNFSADFNKAIEEKQVAEQKVLKAKQELEKARVDAERKVAEAKAEADSLRLQKQEITAELLELRRIEAQLKLIEKWNGVMPIVTSNGNIFDLSSLIK